MICNSLMRADAHKLSILRKCKSSYHHHHRHHHHHHKLLSILSTTDPYQIVRIRVASTTTTSQPYQHYEQHAISTHHHPARYSNGQYDYR